MPKPEPLPQGAPLYHPQVYRQRGAQAARAPFSPLIEQAILFTFFAGAATFWMAVIWWILR
jgi:hypothetical protein